MSTMGFPNTTSTMNGTRSNPAGKTAFIGRLQPTTMRKPMKPEVDFSKGGSDFRCPNNTSAFGKQVLGLKTYSNAPTTRFPSDERFKSAETIGVGPGALAPYTSMKRQRLSSKRSAESTSFGTSYRESALKTYTVYTYKK